MARAGTFSRTRRADEFQARNRAQSAVVSTLSGARSAERGSNNLPSFDSCATNAGTFGGHCLTLVNLEQPGSSQLERQPDENPMRAQSCDADSSPSLRLRGGGDDYCDEEGEGVRDDEEQDVSLVEETQSISDSSRVSDQDAGRNANQTTTCSPHHTSRELDAVKDAEQTLDVPGMRVYWEVERLRAEFERNGGSFSDSTLRALPEHQEPSAREVVRLAHRRERRRLAALAAIAAQRVRDALRMAAADGSSGSDSTTSSAVHDDHRNDHDHDHGDGEDEDDGGVRLDHWGSDTLEFQEPHGEEMRQPFRPHAGPSRRPASDPGLDGSRVDVDQRSGASSNNLVGIFGVVSQTLRNRGQTTASDFTSLEPSSDRASRANLGRATLEHAGHDSLRAHLNRTQNERLRGDIDRMEEADPSGRIFPPRNHSPPSPLETGVTEMPPLHGADPEASSEIVIARIHLWEYMWRRPFMVLATFTLGELFPGLPLDGDMCQPLYDYVRSLSDTLRHHGGRRQVRRMTFLQSEVENQVVVRFDFYLPATSRGFLNRGSLRDSEHADGSSDRDPGVIGDRRPATLASRV